MRYFQNIPNFEHPADPEPIGNATAPNTIVLKKQRPKPVATAPILVMTATATNAGYTAGRQMTGLATSNCS